MIYVVGIVITLFLSFILFTKRDKTFADNILFIWLCVISIQLSLFAIISSQEYLQFPYLLGLEIPIPLLHGVFLFIYTRLLTSQQRTSWKGLLHFIPYTLAFIATIPFLLLSPQEKVNVYRNEGEAYAILTGIIFFGIIVSGITYTILSLKELVKHRNKIKNNYSYTEKINLQWLFWLIIGLSCIWVIVFFADDKYIFSSVVLYVLFIGYFGIKQVGIFTNQLPVEQPLPASTEQPAVANKLTEDSKYDKAALTDQQLKTIHYELMQLITQKKVYLMPELTLGMVSQQLNVHPNILSQVINRVEQKNFFDFINTLRVQEFKERVAKLEHEKYTLLALAHECGFNSKTSFNRNFKSITGSSPSEYLKDLKVVLN
ncbi:AraC family transcriptional regulator [Chryseotalea sanaruensis]|uniref:AraC family transcriptional regulator n=1 Tax=Chryseotalea sanaruensis TaxID=2482724 RepID=A0A401U5Q3_9BACT|nr:helix-turn-helix domain-containing protein [Chryseotalea sanaruensis]GCC50116.1 AraC family transcriptional regulator [Chryseotalea sanaruensis]